MTEPRARRLGRRSFQTSLLALTALSVLAAPRSALAEANRGKGSAPDSGFFAEITILYATNDKKGIDPRIGRMPELQKPPFSSYDSYALLDRQRLPLSKPEPKTLKLPNGRTLATKLVEVLGPDAVRLSASINQPNGKEFLPLLEVKAKLGQPFIVAGQSYERGILVLVIRAVR